MKQVVRMQIDVAVVLDSGEVMHWAAPVTMEGPQPILTAAKAARSVLANTIDTLAFHCQQQFYDKTVRDLILRKYHKDDVDPPKG